MTRLVPVLIGTALFAATGSRLIEQAPPKAAAKPNPYAQQDTAFRAGAKLFERECSACHGTRREGSGVAPSLTGRRVRKAPAGALFWVVRNGAVFHGMPSFAHLPEPQIWQIVTFLQAAESSHTKKP